MLAGVAYVFVDLGCRGSGCFIPRREPVGGQLTGQQRDYSARMGAIRALIERAVANLKTWRILHTDYRRPLHTYEDASTRRRTALVHHETTFCITLSVTEITSILSSAPRLSALQPDGGSRSGRVLMCSSAGTNCGDEGARSDAGVCL